MPEAPGLGLAITIISTDSPCMDSTLMPGSGLEGVALLPGMWHLTKFDQ